MTFPFRAGGTGPADPATAGPIFSAYLSTISIPACMTTAQLTGLCITYSMWSHSRALWIHEVIKCLQSLSASQRLLLEQVCRVGRLLLVMPETNATSERSFSVLRRLKSYLPWAMQTRLNHVMVLSIYKELLDELDLYAVANEFVGSSEYMLRLFGTFTTW